MLHVIGDGLPVCKVSVGVGGTTTEWVGVTTKVVGVPVTSNVGVVGPPVGEAAVGVIEGVRVSEGVGDIVGDGVGVSVGVGLGVSVGAGSVVSVGVRVMVGPARPSSM